MRKDRKFSADKKVTLVGQSFDPEFNEVCFLVEVDDKHETRLFRQYFDVETVLYEGTELVVKREV